MTVVVLIAAPVGLRGHLTRWMVEVNAGVFVGNPSRRIRDRLWTLLADRIGDGQAVLVEPADNEQGWTVRTAGRDRWRPVDFDGLILSARRRNQPNENERSAR
ncbi:type I-E CRISPR-associated endoribonuclease Cas2 [Nocardia sp. SYP-A9097]|uniref:type I-E CRISPR-associated endoribonuclease Cas2e n=1 Tax=Nocardia sp. SYP-A9097 TaxID=2663237 RepID=UPI00129A98F6|nr:type I-E CRISPR-associated endoribonuclease Cas2e [Nocardia sp. SYP-A9097]MRH93416.1 type I-E CRISPR-associated endoribonuclease Cas2 [Nocardia sp. SYP-A9097]